MLYAYNRPSRNPDRALYRAGVRFLLPSTSGAGDEPTPTRTSGTDPAPEGHA